MKVTKRNGELVDLSMDKIVKRLANFNVPGIDIDSIAIQVVSRIYDGVPTKLLDEESARLCVSNTSDPGYAVLAAKIAISNLHKSTRSTFSEKVLSQKDFFSERFYNFALANFEAIDKTIDYSRDFKFDYFGFKTLEKGYLIKNGATVIERPQDMYMRTALQVHLGDIEKAFETYHYISNWYYTFASPTMFNAGSKLCNLSSCFLMGTEDNIQGIFKTISDVAQISKVGGGIGVHINNVRGANSLIKGTNGISQGIVPMLKVYNEVSNYVNQCFVPETLVQSEHGWVQMQNVKIGDLLLTHDSTFQPVSAVHKREIDEHLLVITAEKGSVKVTGDHQILTTDKDATPVFVSAKDLVPGSFTLISDGEFVKANVIKSIEACHYKGAVYDFTVETCHTYHTEIGIVHNSGKRKGAFAIYLSPDHPDILQFLDLRKNQGSDQIRARDLFYALWTPNLFMEAVKNDLDWYLFDPSETGLSEVFGQEYEQEYARLVQEKRYVKKLKAREIWQRVLESQIETGTPYILYKDQINTCSNQKNIGVIKSSNLCAEITLYSDSKEYAVCNLASISLPKYVTGNNFDHDLLFETVKKLILPMNNIIDCNFYPVPEAEKSNMTHRPIGIGVQGLSDVFTGMSLPFASPEACKLNREIFETIYFACLTGSCDLAEKDGVYSSYPGSPISQGKFQFDLWDPATVKLSGRYNWEALRQRILRHGVRNSTLMCQMPTASSAQIMGNTESIEAFDSCIFKRKVLSGDFTVCNKNLVKDLQKLGLWTPELKNQIVLNEGSIQNCDVPEWVKQVYKTVWELSMKTVIDQSADRAVFIDQTQSLNLFVESPTVKKLTSMHFYAYQKGLKTGIYYLRSRSASKAQKFSVAPTLGKKCEPDCDYCAV